MNGFLQMMDSLAGFEELVEAARQNNTPAQIMGVSDSIRAHLVFCMCEKLGRPGLVVAHSQAAAQQLYEDLSFFFGDRVVYFTDGELMFYDVEARAHDVRKLRLRALDRLCRADGALTVVTSVQALVSVTVPKGLYDRYAITLRPGDEIELDTLIQALTALGYRREELVEGAGQFSCRGGIVDLYPYYSDAPFRIEFFDTEVDSVRLFDPESQRTLEMQEEILITPARELLFEDAARERLLKQMETSAKACEGRDEIGQKCAQILRHDADRLREGILFPSLDKYIPILYPEKPTLLDYLAQDCLVFWDDPARIQEFYDAEQSRFRDDLVALAERGILPAADGAYALSLKQAMARLMCHPFFGMSAIAHGGSELRVKQTVTLQAKSLNSFQGRMEQFYDAVRYYLDNQYRVVLLAGAELRARNLIRQMEDEGLHAAYAQALTELPQAGGIVAVDGSLSRGFEYPLIRSVVIGDREIFGGKRKKKRRFWDRRGDKLEHFTDLNEGDYIVHQNYGIGQYIGIEQLSVDGIRKDYLKIRYQGEDFLYVPTDQLDMVYKYIAKEGMHIRLNKLGGGEWNRTKQRVKESAADMAKELISLYAQRMQSPGIAFSADTEWQREFEEAFPYEETEDQLRSVEEIKADMQQPHPMDRLLCGDVGYGKTEVAIRAAFKAVSDGYQVAYLVPTTILASQHYHTFRQRMKDYPIRIAMLSRFCTPAQQKQILKELSTGEVDIVIGTHKLLGKAVSFHKLGLLIIDEEQRFGVGHKEKIKELKKDIDVLTLSATPIPRTLHMSLTGIRDMSVLNQPPGERFPVATYVLAYQEDVIREAINRELGRGGQVYYLFNRVEGIYKVANRIAELAPGARVGVAHGKMHEQELEQIMMDLSEGDLDILVCTTIIETGLDIPNVNTIIIEDADRLGLAQLYQLRGRVGRSNRLAYAYLTFRRNKVLNEDAEKRLLAIKEFTEFGSGFKIAMRDLEIRGTGNLIGAQQHGHMDAVGYEMYCRLLEEAVEEQRGLPVQKKTETQIDLPVSAYIPDAYIPSHNQRIGAYKRIAAITTQEELLDAYDEMEDRYGTVPQVVSNLMAIALLKARAQALGMRELIGGASELVIRFDEENPPDMQSVVNLVQAEPDRYYITTPATPKLHCKIKKEKADTDGRAYLAEVEKFLDQLS